jgi:hypothetical protein
MIFHVVVVSVEDGPGVLDVELSVVSFDQGRSISTRGRCG